MRSAAWTGLVRALGSVLLVGAGCGGAAGDVRGVYQISVRQGDRPTEDNLLTVDVDGDGLLLRFVLPSVSPLRADRDGALLTLPVQGGTVQRPRMTVPAALSGTGEIGDGAVRLSLHVEARGEPPADYEITGTK